jgi:hypothetical protein
VSVIVNENVQSVIVKGDRSQVLVDEILQSIVVQETAQELVVRTAWPEGARKGANADITSLSGITGAISEVDSIRFDVDADITVAEGQIAWNEQYSTLDIGMNGGGVIQHTGFHSYYRIKASAAISKGQLIMFTGAVGASGVLTGAPATGLTNGLFVMGVAAADIANNGFGEVTAFGLVRGFNTTGGAENWQQGDILYYNPAVTGGLTKNPPAPPIPRVVVASVINPAPGGSGSVFVRPTFEPKLNEISDVEAETPVAGSTLIYDAGQTRWEAATLTAGLGVTIANGDGAVTISNALSRPLASATPANNGDLVFELTDNSTLTVKVKGSDGVVRSAALSLT